MRYEEHTILQELNDVMKECLLLSEKIIRTTAYGRFYFIPSNSDYTKLEMFDCNKEFLKLDETFQLLKTNYHKFI